MPDELTDVKFETCTGCQRRRALNANGTIRAHLAKGASRKANPVQCTGSGKPPKKEVVRG